MVSSSCMKVLAIFALITSCLLIVAGILGIVKGPEFLQSQVNQQLPLSADSDQLDSWSTPPVPIYLQFWLWECVNILDFMQGTKPMMVQRGPYTYREHREKDGIAFHDNGTVSYRQKIAYTFIREQSVTDETVPLKMLNLPLVTIVTLLRNQSNFTQEALDLVLREVFKEDLFVTHTIGEWIWGYEDPFLKAIKAIPIIGDFITDDHFGFFLNQNGTDDGLYTVFTGKTNIDLLNIINKWNGISMLPYWRTPWANEINGTDGSWVPPIFQQDLNSVKVYLYSTQICRSLYAKFEKHSSVLDIDTEQFSIPSEVFLNSTLYPDNIGFGTWDSGVLDVSTCNKGAPVFISLPHFLYAAEKYQNQVDGIDPDPEVHRTILQIEPHTGLVLGAQKRLQINTYLKPDPFFVQFQSIPEVIFPSIWINESTTIDQKSANDLDRQVLRLFLIARWVSIAVIIIGAILISVGIVLLRRRGLDKAPSASLNGMPNRHLTESQDGD